MTGEGQPFFPIAPQEFGVAYEFQPGFGGATRTGSISPGEDSMRIKRSLSSLRDSSDVREWSYLSTRVPKARVVGVAADSGSSPSSWWSASGEMTSNILVQDAIIEGDRRAVETYLQTGRTRLR